MQTIEIRTGIKIGFDELVQSVSKLNPNELNMLLGKLNQVQTTNVTTSSQEDTLLKQIKEIIPASVIRRFKELQTKSSNEKITEKELTEILFLTDFIEEKSAERVLLLNELSKIRKISILELVKQLRIRDFHA